MMGMLSVVTDAIASVRRRFVEMGFYRWESNVMTVMITMRTTVALL